MPKLPRDLSGAQLIRVLHKLGYVATRQTGSHVRLSCLAPTAHHITIPLHDPLRIGTMASILAEVAQAQGVSREALLHTLFG
jgi:predicted RNA binding protein YcfA (HicA-like mRNA interferase family)